MTAKTSRTPGFVYILTNPAIPEFVKVGKTTSTPRARAKQLSAATGVPAPFAVAWSTFVADCEAVERLAHAALHAARLRNNREFFRLPVEAAIRAVEVVAAPHVVEGP